MWFAYTDNFSNWHVLKIDQVREIIAQNKEKKRVSSLEDFAIEIIVEQEANFNNAMGQESLTRFDQPKKSNKNKNKSKNKVVAPTDQVQVKNPNQERKIIQSKNLNKEKNPNPNQNKNLNQEKKITQDKNPNQEKKPNPNQQNKRPIIIKKNEDTK